MAEPRLKYDAILRDLCNYVACQVEPDLVQLTRTSLPGAWLVVSLLGSLDRLIAVYLPFQLICAV